MNNNLKTPVRYGIIGALIAAILSFACYFLYMHTSPSLTVQSAIDFLSFAAILFIMIWGGITYRRERGGVLSYGDAFLAVFIIYAISAVGGMTRTYIIPNFVDQQYPERMLEMSKQTTEELMDKFGIPEDQKDKAMEKLTIDKFKPSFIQSLGSYAVYLLIGAIISAIIAAFVKRSGSPNMPPSSNPVS